MKDWLSLLICLWFIAYVLVVAVSFFLVCDDCVGFAFSLGLGRVYELVEGLVWIRGSHLYC